MANTSAVRFVGPTTAIGVSSASSTAITITPNGNDQVNFVGFLNPNNFPVAVSVASSQLGSTVTAPASVLPTGGNTSQSLVLGVSMSQPLVVACPATPYSVTAICASGSSGTIYVMPMADQS
jgi:hypothetical protein